MSQALVAIGRKIKPKVVSAIRGHRMLPAIVPHDDPQHIPSDRQPGVENFSPAFFCSAKCFE